MHEEPNPWVRVLTAVTCAATVAMLPVFLLGATAPAVRADLHFDAWHLGVAVSAFWVAMAVGGLAGGRIAQTVGARAATWAGVAIAAASLGGIAAAPSWTAVVCFAAAGGIATSLVTPAGDMAVFAATPTSRLGIAYGVKQAALPAASLLAGVGVPVLVLTVGWRWAFLAAILVAVPALAILPRRLPVGPAAEPATGRGTRTGRPPRLHDVTPVAVAVGLAMAAVSATGAFYIESAVSGGIPAGTAGVLLAFGGVLGIAGRFLISWRLSRLPRPYLVVAVLLVLGGLGSAGFGVAGATAGGGAVVLAVATVPAFAAGWGWNGLLTQTVVASHPEAPARASAYIVVGAAVGGVLGPTLFGLVVTAAGYRPAWLCCAAALGLGAAVLGMLVRSRGPRVSAGS